MRKNTRYGKIREATVAGIFYPDDGVALAADIAGFLAAGTPGVRASRVIVSPHGCFRYSGALAGLAWKSATGAQVRRVVVIGPSHRNFEKGIFLPESSTFRTPLGDIRVDDDMVESLGSCGTLFMRYDIPHMEEHSVELQLPFMQALFPEAMLVPVILGKADGTMVRMLSRALDTVFREGIEGTLFVVSSNLASSADAESCRAMSDRFIDSCAKSNWDDLDVLAKEPQGPCGASCLSAVMRTSFAGSLAMHKLGAGTSDGMRDSEEERIVGYAALAFGGES